MAPRVTIGSRLRVPDRTAARQVDTETVLLNLESGIYFGLDEVGSRMWQLIAAGVPLADAHRTLLEEYDVEPAQLEFDLIHLVEQLVAHRLVDADVGDRPE